MAKSATILHSECWQLRIIYANLIKRLLNQIELMQMNLFNNPSNTTAAARSAGVALVRFVLISVVVNLVVC